MPNVHGRRTQITVDANDFTPFTNTSEFTRGADKHDTTPYGVDDHKVEGGLRSGDFTMGGIYDSTASTGPHNFLKGRTGTTCAMIRKPEGTGTGKPTETFSAVLEEFKETNPVADFIKWSAKFTVSGAVADTVQ